MLRNLVSKPAIRTQRVHQDNIDYQTLQYVYYITQTLESSGLIHYICNLTNFRKIFRLLRVSYFIGWNLSTVLAPYNRAPHNRYQPHTAEPAQHTTCSNTRLVLLKMGRMMTETCWESVDNKHLTVASCWFSLSLHSLLPMHGHRNLKLTITYFPLAQCCSSVLLKTPFTARQSCTHSDCVLSLIWETSYHIH